MTPKSGGDPTARRALRRILRVAAWTGLTVALAAAVYLVVVDRQITGTFEGRRWSAPAIVYAQPMELYPGLPITQDDLVGELKRLGYRPSADTASPGSFHRVGNRLGVHLREFHFMERRRPARRIELEFEARAIQSIRGDGPIALIRLEPPVIGSIFPAHGEDRLVLTPPEIPDLLRRGLIAVEDRNFLHHPGFDPEGIARAFWVNLTAGEIRQGGSTITQQLVKSYFLDNRRTIERKVRELFMAMVIDARFEKADILDAYINEIYLGQDGDRAIHGFGLGAQLYFNRPLTELSPAQIATLIAIIRGPSYYNPARHPERTRTRRNRVLEILEADGLIDADTLIDARGSRLAVTTSGTGGSYYPAFLDTVRQTLAAEYEADDLASQGLRVFTTLDPRIQDHAIRALDVTIHRLEQSRNLAAGKLEGAVVVTRALTGDVLAVVGGREAGGFNRALNAKRPIGSLIKPLVYLTAMQDTGVNLATLVHDDPVSVMIDANTQWQPHNFDERVHGPMPAVQALARSLNLATVNVGLEVGVDRVAANLAHLAGVPVPAAYPSLLLGAVDLSPLQVAALYGHFASGGFDLPPKSVVAVLSESGAPIRRYPIEVRQQISTQHAAQITAALQVAMARGTGARSPHARSGAAGKTGTSNEYRDSWFAGYDASHLTIVWLGRDDNAPVGLTGSSGALKVWDRLVDDLDVQPLAPGADGLRTAAVAWTTGNEARPGCADTVQILIPASAQLDVEPGCHLPGRGSWGDRIRAWLGN